MTSPLQTAHEAATAAADPIVCTVAGPRSHFTREIYNGAELQTRSARAGAYDAQAIPSLFNGRPRPLTGHRQEAARPQPTTSRGPVAVCEPLPERRASPMPLPARAPVQSYRPREGSCPDRVMKALTASGPNAAISYIDLVKDFQIPRWAIGPSFVAAVSAGALLRVTTREGRAGFALAGYVAPAPEPVTDPVPAAEEPATPPLATFREVAAAHAQLEQRKATLAALQAQVEALDKRLTLRSIQGYLERLTPIDHAPAA